MPKTLNRQTILANLITKAKQAYYFSGQPIMSDAEYDALESELAQLCPAHKLLKSVGAPIPDASNHLKKVKHSMPMGSQAKVNTAEEFDTWCARRQTADGLHCSLKADGCSIAAYYKKGQLVQVVSRGDGETGEDVTANALSFKNLPTVLAEPIDCSVRLEAVLTVKDWLTIDPDKSSNPRSLANGILGRKDGKNSHLLSALAFDLEGIELDNESDKNLWLEQSGFTTTTWQLVKSPDQVQSFLHRAQQERNLGTWLYWSDGVVIKLNSLKEQQKLGATSGRPKGQIAWKFSAEQASATLEQVEWSVGHTGAITPIANISPVRLGGTTVQRISLANPDMITALGIRMGSQVEVVKAGDIIPKITKVVKAGRGAPIPIPAKCPSCQSPLKKILNVDGSQSTVLYCRNVECEAQGYGRIRRWAKSRDILGLGDSVIQALCDSGQVQSVPDLFSLSPAKIQNLIINPIKKIRLGHKRATHICQEIEKKGTQMSLAEFLGSFGTHRLGVRRAVLMTKANPALTSLEKWFDGSLTEDGFAGLAGVPNLGTQIFEGLKEREEEIRSVLKFVQILQPQKAPKIKLPAICITGTLPSGKKKHDWEQPLAQAGYSLVDTVSKDLHALVVSNPSQVSSKTKKAIKLGIRIMTEADLQELCQASLQK
jgi:DNA ligase (NAD+)